MRPIKKPAEARGKKPRQAKRGNGAIAQPPVATCADAFRRLATGCLAEIAANRHAADLGQVEPARFTACASASRG